MAADPLSNQITELKYKVLTLEREVEKLTTVMEELLDSRKDIYQLFENRRIELTREIKEIYAKIDEIDSGDFQEMKSTVDQLRNLKWMFYGIIFIIGWLFSNIEIGSFIKLMDN